MDPVLKDRTSFKQIKRADGLRGCGLNNIHIFDNGSNQIQWKELDFSGLSALKAPNCQNWGAAFAATLEEGMRPLGWTQSPKVPYPLSQSPAPMDPGKVHVWQAGSDCSATAGNQGLDPFFLLDGSQRQAPQSRFLNLGSTDPTKSPREF